MYASNRNTTSMKMQSHISDLWASMRRDSHGAGGPWLCAYVETWVETRFEDSLTEQLFSTL